MTATCTLITPGGSNGDPIYIYISGDLVSGPPGNSYHLEASLLNWDHVSQKAQDRAEEGLRKYLVTTADSRKLYGNAMHNMNWETLQSKSSWSSSLAPINMSQI